MNERKLLVVDDDKRLRELLERYLGEQGFVVRSAEDAAAMDRELAHEAFDLVVLDLMLPGEDGLSICRRLRAGEPQQPIIMLTAKGDDIDRIVGLEMGADDYVAKPFGPREFVARVRAVLRRSMGDPAAPARAERRLRFAGWLLDLKGRELFSPAGAAVDLSGAEYDMLLAFCEHPQRVLSREQLLDLARNRMAFSGTERAVDVMVSRLRRKLEPTEDSPTIIKTIRGAGYMLVPAVKRGT